VKLTKAQHAMLLEIRDMAQHVSDSYVPAKKLVALQLAEWRDVKFGRVLEITPAGLSALSAVVVEGKQGHE
jgi:hypothetical protein